MKQKQRKKEINVDAETESEISQIVLENTE